MKIEDIFVRGLAFAMSTLAMGALLISLRLGPYPSWLEPRPSGEQFFVALLFSYLAGVLFSVSSPTSH
jgi:hypothetical protein